MYLGTAFKRDHRGQFSVMRLRFLLRKVRCCWLANGRPLHLISPLLCTLGGITGKHDGLSNNSINIHYSHYQQQKQTKLAKLSKT